LVPLNSERFADRLSDEASDFSTREAGKKVFCPDRESSCASRIQFQAFGNQKKGRRFLRLRPFNFGFGCKLQNQRAGGCGNVPAPSPSLLVRAVLHECLHDLRAFTRCQPSSFPGGSHGAPGPSALTPVCAIHRKKGL